MKINDAFCLITMFAHQIKEQEAKKEAEARMITLEKMRAQERKNQAQYPSRSMSAPAWAQNSMGGGDIPSEPLVQTVKEKKYVQRIQKFDPSINHNCFFKACPIHCTHCSLHHEVGQEGHHPQVLA